jgi:hypothetical protein
MRYPMSRNKSSAERLIHEIIFTNAPAYISRGIYSRATTRATVTLIKHHAFTLGAIYA